MRLRINAFFLYTLHQLTGNFKFINKFETAIERERERESESEKKCVDNRKSQWKQLFQDIFN